MYMRYEWFHEREKLPPLLSAPPLLIINELPLLRRLRLAPICSRGLLLRLARIELGDDLGRDTVELLLGEDAQERPCEVE